MTSPLLLAQQHRVSGKSSAKTALAAKQKLNTKQKDEIILIMNIEHFDLFHLDIFITQIVIQTCK